MPGMDGFSLARACRLLRSDLPLLYMSGFADMAERAESQFPGELLQKPFRQSELASAARRALEARSLVVA